MIAPPQWAYIGMESMLWIMQGIGFLKILRFRYLLMHPHLHLHLRLPLPLLQPQHLRLPLPLPQHLRLPLPLPLLPLLHQPQHQRQLPHLHLHPLLHQPQHQRQLLHLVSLLSLLLLVIMARFHHRVRSMLYLVMIRPSTSLLTPVTT